MRVRNEPEKWGGWSLTLYVKKRVTEISITSLELWDFNSLLDYHIKLVSETIIYNSTYEKSCLFGFLLYHFTNITIKIYWCSFFVCKSTVTPSFRLDSIISCLFFHILHWWYYWVGGGVLSIFMILFEVLLTVWILSLSFFFLVYTNIYKNWIFKNT